MTVAQFVIAADRGLLAVSGDDRVTFLQGLVSNDVARVAPDRSLYATLLTPQGKFLHDLFVASWRDGLVLDCEGARAADLKKRLTMYRLRAKVTIAEPESALAVGLAFGEGVADRFGLPEETGATCPFGEGVAFVDPRLPALGVRTILPAATAAEALADLGLQPGERDTYDMIRVRSGVPDGSRDMPVDGAILLENGIDVLNGVDWNKGCYMGQELTARTHYRGLVKRRLIPVEIDGPAPEPGSDVLLEDKNVGVTRSTAGADGDLVGLVLLRLDALEKAEQAGAALTAGDATLHPLRPEWANY